MHYRLKIIDRNDFPLEDYRDKSSSNKSKSRGSKSKIKQDWDDDDTEEALALMTTQEELPQVAGVIDDSRMKTKFTTGMLIVVELGQGIPYIPYSHNSQIDQAQTILNFYFCWNYYLSSCCHSTVAYFDRLCYIKTKI